MKLRILHFAEDALAATVSRDLLDRVVAERGPHWLQDNFSDAEVRPQLRQFTDRLPVVGQSKRRQF